MKRRKLITIAVLVAIALSGLAAYYGGGLAGEPEDVPCACVYPGM